MRGRFWPNFEAIKWCSGPLLPTDRDRRRGVGLVKCSAYMSPESPNFIQHLRFIVGIHPLIGGSSPRQSPFLRLTPKFSFGQIVVVPPQRFLKPPKTTKQSRLKLLPSLSDAAQTLASVSSLLPRVPALQWSTFLQFYGGLRRHEMFFAVSSEIPLLFLPSFAA